jgi:hypothetical protein
MENPNISGFFTSTGNPYSINLLPGVNFITVYNYTQIAAAANSVNQTFYWQQGMPVGGGIASLRANGGPTNSLVALVGNGFVPFDSAVVGVQGPAFAVTAITAANPVVVSSGTTPLVGQIIRLNMLTDKRPLASIDAMVTAVTLNTSFTLGFVSEVNATGATTGFWRLVANDNSSYIPRQRNITWITSSLIGTVPAGATRIYTSVAHGYVVGEKVNIQMPGGRFQWGNFYALNNTVATIIAVNTAANGSEPAGTLNGFANNFDIAFDSNGFGAWNLFPSAAATGAFGTGAASYLANGNFFQSPAIVIPFGEDMSYAVSVNQPNPMTPNIQTSANTLADSLDNIAARGIILGGGNLTANDNAGPAGAIGDIMYWVASTSFDTIPQLVNPTSP